MQNIKETFSVDETIALEPVKEEIQNDIEEHESAFAEINIDELPSGTIITDTEIVVGGEEINTIGTFTTRDAQAIKKCLDTGVFTDDELMLYQIVQTKDEDYINQIGRNLDEQEGMGEFTTSGGRKLLTLFHNVANAKKEADFYKRELERLQGSKIEENKENPALW